MALAPTRVSQSVSCTHRGQRLLPWSSASIGTCGEVRREEIVVWIGTVGPSLGPGRSTILLGRALDGAVVAGSGLAGAFKTNGAGATTRSRNSGWLRSGSKPFSLERLARMLLASPSKPSLKER